MVQDLPNTTILKFSILTAATLFIIPFLFTASILKSPVTINDNIDFEQARPVLIEFTLL